MKINYYNEEFIMTILHFYAINADGNAWSISKATITAAVNKTLNFLCIEDRIHTTNHEEIFRATMIEQTISANNCSAVGISRRTFYRYKKRYIKIFGAYLQQYDTQ